MPEGAAEHISEDVEQDLPEDAQRNIVEGTEYSAFASSSVEGPLGKLLDSLDFSGIIQEKSGQYMQGTRHWLFDEFHAWNKTAIDSKDKKRKLFWLMGAGGTGKSVISAELLRRGVTSSEKLGCKILAWYSYSYSS